jgi:CpeS-like protein
MMADVRICPAENTREKFLGYIKNCNNVRHRNCDLGSLVHLCFRVQLAKSDPFCQMPTTLVRNSPVTPSLQVQSQSDELLIANFFKQSEGQWRSERRYYTLPDGAVKEMVSRVVIRFLEPGCPELCELAKLHELDDQTTLTCGAAVTWDSEDSVSGKKQSQGSTVFGVLGSTLYRDRGFATSKPVTASFYFTNSDSLCLKTEYKGSVFEEELKLVGSKYRTRQTIISRAGEQQMIGQYLEKRIG